MLFWARTPGHTTPTWRRIVRPLEGMAVVSLAINIPGPIAAARLRELGARVTKIEPPPGDPLALFSRTWYDELCQGMDVTPLDLKTSAGQATLRERLQSADLLLTANRPSALGRLGLDWPSLQALNPRLCHVGIVGHAPPDEEKPGHDLTYQAAIGTLSPPALPRVLLADMAGAQEAVAASLTLLLGRERCGEAGQTWVSLESAAREFAATLREGITVPGGMLGGGIPNYHLYASADGYIALAALEPHFLRRLLDTLGRETIDETALRSLFLTGTGDFWVAWARKHQIPLAKVE